MRYWNATLYKTHTGRYFLYGRGHAMSPYASHNCSTYGPGRKMILLTRDEAISWCEENRIDTNTVISEFPEVLEEPKLIIT